jgi:phosphonate degradation associated HDIG domain protein
LNGLFQTKEKRSMTDPVDKIFELFASHGAERYGGERISQLAHALQCGHLAEQAGASTHLITAALLHDVGHLVGKGDEGLASKGIDARHEEIAAVWLSRWFGPEVIEPIREHVAAKRYLCRVEPGYFETLTQASVTSLKVQGGAFSAEEADGFAALPHATEAVLLRRWDEEGKDPTRVTPDLEHFRSHVTAALA